MNKRMLILPVLLGFALACNLVNTPVDGSGPVSGPAGDGQTIPSDPVSIREGLASLNSYTFVIESNSSGPGQTEYSNARIEIKNSKEQDADSTHYIVNSMAEDETEPSTTDSFMYSIGNIQCSGSDADEWDYSEITPQQKEMTDLYSEMVDILPLIDSPTFVGSELMNGVMSNHFTFTISGLGLQPGVEATANQGEYWLAQDGQYIVKYQLVTETVDTATQSRIHMQVLIDLTGINQPVSIALPAGCVP